MNGVIKRIQSDKGFGFIRGEGGEEYFFHKSACNGDFNRLQEGQKVTFEGGMGDKGLRADSVYAA